MKKKIVSLLALVLLISLMLTMLVACDEIFKKNDERDANQAVAKITYGNQVAYITKAQLTTSFNSYAPSYVQYYGMSYQQAADYIVKSLAQRELLVLYAKAKIAELENLGAPENLELKQFVSNLEYIDAIEKVNKDFQTSLETAIKDLIEEEEANKGAQTTTDSGVYTHAKITKDNKQNAIYVTFDSDGGSAVEKQTILKGEAADRPTNPTKSGYTFMGWYKVTDGVVSDTLYPFGADATINSNLQLKAKWVPTKAARTEKPKAEEDTTNYDYSKYDTEAEIKAAKTDADVAATLKFFDDGYAATAKADAKENLELTDEEINAHFDKAMKTLKDNLGKLYTSYDYYLTSELKTLILNKYQRLLGYDVTVSQEEVDAEYNRIVAGNIEKYGSSDSAYETAIKGTLADAIYQNYGHDTVTDTQDSYGFVINILLKLGDDEVAELTQMVTDGTYSKDQIIARRNELLREVKVAISNPDYSSTAECEYYTEDVDNYVAYDPQTNPNHECTCLNPDHSHDYTVDNDYNQIATFGKDEDGNWAIIYNIKECPKMPYIHDGADEGNILYLPAFTDGAQIGIVEQVYNSFKAIDDAVTAGTLTKVEAVYWYREMATAWLYLIGDDSGGTSSDSNNGGLGYLVPAENSSVASSFLTDFTNQARALIKNGVGSYTIGGLDGSYVFADSFIDSGSTSGGYAGIFMIMTSYVAYDENAYTFETPAGTELDSQIVAITDTTSKNLPKNYVVTYAKDLEDCKTIYDIIYNKLLDGKKYEKYSLEVNSFGEKYMDTIVYNEKAYKTLWKKLDA